MLHKCQRKNFDAASARWHEPSRKGLVPDLGQCTDDTFRVVPAVFHCLCRRTTLDEAQGSVRSGRRGACHSVSMTSRLFLYDKVIWLSGPCHRELLASSHAPVLGLPTG
ncbi:hypothetical protein DVU_2648 [Nitratidesulfovibrio vulgaris str. Hildenborough]|uniref:Uncharacterized protein n=1 Tax=Nitratidesulfovibrio vulgaris (strain ATCC 29579 / DSM 644 / CCUG 34227 / NCIMB 8303 / VKM B-1760 / Hildenborough) TaxID=882 RepID=Q728F5_NITV2|nr:hypothetical protein DVU_2648 [Nitratidesulfovibrio vulgaris str. Hildenborough]